MALGCEFPFTGAVTSMTFEGDHDKSDLTIDQRTVPGPVSFTDDIREQERLHFSLCSSLYISGLRFHAGYEFAPLN